MAGSRMTYRPKKCIACRPAKAAVKYGVRMVRTLLNRRKKHYGK